MKINSGCRDCGSKNLVKFLDLTDQPPANRFLKIEEFATERRYPLQGYFCESCHLAQLIHVVDKEELFSHYLYFSAGMPKVSAYWQSYAEDVMKRFLSKNDFVAEIGSNDGILLKFFKDSGYKVLGIDPAENIAPVAEKIGVPTLVDFFNEAIGKEIAKKHGQAKAILANNVVAHIDDHLGLCAGIRSLLHPDGAWVIEAPYLIDMFQNLTYDTIYHEHLSFLAVRPLSKLFARYGLEIFDLYIVPAQGQSLRLFVGHQGKHPVTQRVRDALKQEQEYKLDDKKSYIELAKRVEGSRTKLVSLLKDLKKQGKRIAAYGAPAKGMTLLNYCKIGPDLLEYALDDLPSKQELYTPGMHVRVVGREYAEKNPPDYYLLLAWNYLPAILEKEKQFQKKGGKFIIPVGDDIKII